tara:strand:+ start:1982 stop:2536 length:555 start_codon:yes stop_codon:yes gene_type:complete
MKNIRKTPIFLIFIFLFSSCVKYVDFEQIEDLTVEPVFTSSLVYFTLDQVTFFDRINSVEVITPISKTSKFLSLNSSFVKNNLIKLELEFEISNQFDRDFTINVEFLDDNNTRTHRFNTFNVDANNLNYAQKEVINIINNQLFLSSTKIRVSVQLSPSNNGAVINPNVVKNLVFKTAGTFFLKL